MCDVLRSALTFELLVFSVPDTMILFVPLDMRLGSLALAVSHRVSNFRMVLGHP